MAAPHPFVGAPHRTLLRLSVPVLVSLVAEPATGLVDTAFVARLGTAHLAALGIGTMAFSAVFWAFNFLSIGSQTETSHALGRRDSDQASRICSLAVIAAGAIGMVLALLALPCLEDIAALLGGQGQVRSLAVDYMRWRLLGAPAVLVALACFGALRGLQDMRTPLVAALGINGLNVLLDWAMIFGAGPFPALGVAGAGLATSLSQWAGGLWLLVVVRRRIGLTWRVSGRDARRLFAIGWDLFLRSGMVLLFLSLCTRAANQGGAGPGAAHQAIRQFFVFAALFLDAFAVAGQSLVGYFLVRGERAWARRVAALVCWWSLGTGLVLGSLMLLLRHHIAWLLVPPGAAAAFYPAWTVVALMQPMSSLSYATDGLHWGTGDFTYLRNAMFLASVTAGTSVVLIMRLGPEPLLVWIWLATVFWSAIRAGLGLIRIWPGIGHGPLRQPDLRTSENT